MNGILLTGIELYIAICGFLLLSAGAIIAALGWLFADERREKAEAARLEQERKLIRQRELIQQLTARRALEQYIADTTEREAEERKDYEQPRIVC